jgi:hypothetical protein
MALEIVCKNLRFEREAFGLIDHLLVDAGVLSTHDDVASGGVYLSVKAGVAYQVDNPTFGSFLVHVQLLGEHSYVDALMNATVSLKDEEASILDKLISARDQEKIIHKHLFTLAKFLLRGIKVKIDVQIFKKLGNWVAVGVAFLLYSLDKVSENVSTPLICDNSGRQIAKNVRAGRLYCVQVLRLEKHIHNSISTIGVIKKYK